jgi:endonuclease/exonuclease/phosphatase (EEP) superfamily protein YafD
VHNSCEALTRLSELARDYRADLVAVNEAPDISREDIAALFRDLPLQHKATNAPDGAELTEPMLFAVRATDIGQIATMPYGGRAILRFQLATGDRPIRIVITHPEAPGNPGDMAKRDLLLSHIGDGLDETRPFIVLGDLNVTPWGRAFGLVPGQRAGDPRFDGTFPSFAGPLGIPIDHMMFGGGLMLTDFRIGPDIGSHHRPLLATFAAPAD